MKKLIFVFTALASLSSVSSFSASAEKSCTQYYSNCEGGGAVMGKTMSYELSDATATVTTLGSVTGTQTCVADLVRSGYKFNDCKGLLQFSVHANGTVAMSDTDGCYAYYRCN